MAENEITLPQLCELLRSWNPRQHARNLVLVAMPLASAHQQAPALAEAINATYLDFDCALLQQLEADDWDDHLQLEKKGHFTVGQMVAKTWLETVAVQLQPQKPLVIGNLNLAVRYKIDVAAALYDATERGLCVIAGGGRLQGQTLLIHGEQPQTGASAPTYQVAELTDPPATWVPTPIQDRLL